MIRRAEIKDIERIGELLSQVNGVHYKGRPDLFKKGRKYTDEELREIICDDNRPILVSVNGEGFVLGYAFCIFQRHEGSNLMTDIKTLYISGAFGTKINPQSAVNIGLFPSGLKDKTHFIGNGALDGASKILFDNSSFALSKDLSAKAKTLFLGGSKDFNQSFIKNISF